MKNTRLTLSEDKRNKVAESLNIVIVDLIDLSMQTLQAHWAAIGPRFKSFHEHMDELLAVYRVQVDEIGERMLALGVVPNGQSHVVVKHTELEPIPDGFIQSDDLITMLADRLAAVARRIRSQQAIVCEIDPASDDLLIGLIEQLEKQLWMLQAIES